MGGAGEATEVCVTWPIRMCDTTHSYVWHDSFSSLIVIKSTWVPLARPQRCVWHDIFVCVTCLLPMYDTNPLYVWHGSFLFVTCEAFVCVTWLIHTCDMTFLKGWLSWRAHGCRWRGHRGVFDMPYSCVWNVFFLYTTRILPMYDMSHSYLWHVNHSYVWHDVFVCMKCFLSTCDVTPSFVWHDVFLYMT